jgi:hypothetical protein
MEIYMPLTYDWFSAKSYQSFQREKRSVRGVIVETDASVFRFTWDKITVNFTIILFLLAAGDFWWWTLDGVGGHRHVSAALPLRQIRYRLNKWLDGLQSRSN